MRIFVEIGLIAWLALTQVLAAEEGFTLNKATPAEKKSIAAIEKLGGKVTFKPKFSVDLSQSQVTDSDLAHVKALSGLEHLDLSESQVTDAGLAHLKGLSKLISLTLFRTKVTDAGLVHVKGLTSLELLNLQGLNVTDAGIVGVSYYDFRLNGPEPESTTDSWLVLCDPGKSDCSTASGWNEEIRLTDFSFDYSKAPSAGGLFLGDYMGLASAGPRVPVVG